MSTAAADLALREAARCMSAARWPTALEHLERALVLEPRHAVLWANKARCLLALGRSVEARAAVEAAWHAESRDPRVWDLIGGVSSFAGDQTRALAAYNRAVTLSRGDPQFLFNRAAVRRFLGDLAGAETDYDRVIALRPDDAEAYKNRTDLRVQTPARNHVEQLERIAAAPIADWRAEVQIGYALAKELEDLGRHAESFERLRRAASLRRRHIDYDVSQDVATVDWIIEAMHAAPRADPDACAQDAPIFIVGLPRSGTTLVDRILGSHRAVTSAGELDAFALALVGAVRGRTGGAPPPRREMVRQSALVDFPTLGHEYLRRARLALAAGVATGVDPTEGGDAVAGNGRRFTDKMPLNYLYCGLILRALPRARIVHLTRHPLASCYAMYKTLFRDGYPFSYDLGELARYYAAYRRLMDFWRATLPGAIHDLSYEALVADPEGESRRLLDDCDLPWEPGCLRFHDNASPSTTASAAQIRRPLYTSSVAQWRHYEQQLSELRERLQAEGIDT